MKQCLDIASKGLGNVAPNPLVGCVIIHEGEVIGEGYHEKYGEAHAEVNAIHSVKDKELLKKATLYVNLEPCSHHGKTPPCADLIIKHKIPFVVIGNLDNNPIVAGKGIKKLIDAGIDVKIGVLEYASKKLNKRFFTFHNKKRPFVILKWAQSADDFIDGKRIDNTTKPAQISNSDSKQLLHLWRSQEQAIMVGTNTALLDNPKLTVRGIEGINPLRIVIDKSLRVPTSFNLLDNSTPTIVFTDQEKEFKKNLEFIKIDFSKNIIPQMMDALYLKNIQSIIIEGGGELLNSFIENDLWDSARVFVAKKKLTEGIQAPELKMEAQQKEDINGDQLFYYFNDH